MRKWRSKNKKVDGKAVEALLRLQDTEKSVTRLLLKYLF